MKTNSTISNIKTKMAPKKILVSAKWKEQFTKLQTEVLKIPKLEKVIEEKDEEIVAEYLRAASGNLERILGKIDIEDVLGDIFSSFCIGK